SCPEERAHECRNLYDKKEVDGFGISEFQGFLRKACGEVNDCIDAVFEEKIGKQELTQGLVLKNLTKGPPRFPNSPARGLENSHVCCLIPGQPEECRHGEDKECDRNANPCGRIHFLLYEEE